VVALAEVLGNYARHHVTHEPLAGEVPERIRAARSYGQGFALTEYLGAALLDLEWHRLAPGTAPDADGVEAFEEAALARHGLGFHLVPPRYRSSYFAHIFSGGYSAGYYSYVWSEVLDADTVEWFREQGGLRRELGRRFAGSSCPAAAPSIPCGHTNPSSAGARGSSRCWSGGGSHRRSEGAEGARRRQADRVDTVEITVRTGSTLVTDLTAELQGFCAGRGDGLAHVFVPHATAGVAVMETGSGSEPDLADAIDRMLPGPTSTGTATARPGTAATTCCRRSWRRRSPCRCSTGVPRSAPGRASCSWTATATTPSAGCGSASSRADVALALGDMRDEVSVRRDGLQPAHDLAGVAGRQFEDESVGRADDDAPRPTGASHRRRTSSGVSSMPPSCPIA
jgi:hypothetical protein